MISVLIHGFLLLLQYHRDGYLVVENFLSDEDVASLKKGIEAVIDDFRPDQHPCTVFSTAESKQVLLFSIHKR